MELTRVLKLSGVIRWIQFLCFVVMLWLQAQASALALNQELAADEKISQLYANLASLASKGMGMSARLDKISAEFLGKVYILGALGEGALARYDQFPRYRTDAFDCETFVTTVLAIANAQNTEAFKQRLCELRYINNQTEYIERNHFTELDWNLNNAAKGFIKDITTLFKNQEGEPVYKIATALINKPAWYQAKDAKNIRLLDGTAALQQARLEELKKKGVKLSQVYSHLPYLPFSALFLENGRPDMFLFRQIPDAAIVEIVRPNWNLEKEIGTNLNVSHLGFVFWKNGVPIFRQASSIYAKVVDVPLIDYLQEARKSPTIKGINVQMVLGK